MFSLLGKQFWTTDADFVTNSQANDFWNILIADGKISHVNGASNFAGAPAIAARRQARYLAPLWKIEKRDGTPPLRTAVDLRIMNLPHSLAGGSNSNHFEQKAALYDALALPPEISRPVAQKIFFDWTSPLQDAIRRSQLDPERKLPVELTEIDSNLSDDEKRLFQNFFEGLRAEGAPVMNLFEITIATETDPGSGEDSSEEEPEEDLQQLESIDDSSSSLEGSAPNEQDMELVLHQRDSSEKPVSWRIRHDDSEFAKSLPFQSSCSPLKQWLASATIGAIRKEPSILSLSQKVCRAVDVADHERRNFERELAAIYEYVQTNLNEEAKHASTYMGADHDS